MFCVVVVVVSVVVVARTGCVVVPAPVNPLFTVVVVVKDVDVSTTGVVENVVSVDVPIHHGKSNVVVAYREGTTNAEIRTGTAKLLNLSLMWPPMTMFFFMMALSRFVLNVLTIY